MQLRINLNLTLYRVDSSVATSYATRVEDMQGERLKLSLPTEGGVPVYIPRGERIRCEFTAEGGIYSFTVEVLGWEQRPIPTLIVEMPKQFQRLQRRDYVRLEANLAINYSVLCTGDATREQWLRSQTRDISGGGLLFKAPDKLPIGAQLEVYLTLEGNTIHTSGEVVRYLPDMVDSEPGNWMGLRFLDINERDRDMIIRYIFNQQRERRKRGLV